MSTASFDRSFDIQDSKSAVRLNEDLQSPRSVKVAKRDYANDDNKGVLLLKQRFSGSQQR
ncbi:MULTISPECIES: hypothetical protein [Idiomarina]|jgi:hypothetical protein|uniref:Uncharacterized protein n=1 Tax=Idiomarina loihiensis (strain ATCC BAA-735 / DSM 15497 / L2-TR) TaxID=283942 RepID=Q5R099_IDILO|nr:MULTISPECIES: hypothetical protein [Idiomarina]MAC35050.1 hypothetical protein [Haliea sp.]AAV81490.1 Hypothetical protein IL0649 [Idiomarina loihiensis L2TR]AGM35517.1 hypothetical protein K734_03250 [Idiomarina loihiensis GSL 199]MAO68185.1 hypothetical protein [Idiomarina sp.]MBF79937.1 hypothetical protein [Idiomarina sp.]|tara:strand:- start:2029 stop:2208 length:180 start_codon:yes stop_codon:yes gene_type:complete